MSTETLSRSSESPLDTLDNSVRKVFKYSEPFNDAMAFRLDIEDMHSLAKSKEGVCLSKRYAGPKTKLRWRCNLNHEWRARPNNIQQGNWCPICGINKRNDHLRGTLKEMQKLAKKRGGKCLSTKYVNNSTKLLWKCAKGHKWNAGSNSIKHGRSWCPYCSGKVKSTIEDMKKIAELKGGKCISKKYINNKNALRWQCGDGHQWNSTTVRFGSWCPYCLTNAPLTLSDIKKDVTKKGGKILSKRYFNNLTPLKVKCKVGHFWTTNAANIRSGYWCKYCSLKSSWLKREDKLTIKDMKTKARDYDGHCLSKKYIVGLPLTWKCHKGHIWKAGPNSIRQGHWCGDCLQSIGEIKTRETFENIFQKPFKKVRPSWLIGSKGLPLELDGYCSDLKVAFEYNGQQHYKYSPLLHKSKNLAYWKRSDGLKRKLCKKNSVVLIEVPYTVKIDNLPSFISSELKRNRRGVD